MSVRIAVKEAEYYERGVALRLPVSVWSRDRDRAAPGQYAGCASKTRAGVAPGKFARYHPWAKDAGIGGGVLAYTMQRYRRSASDAAFRR